MKLANVELLDEFVQKHSQAEKPLNKWIEKITIASWRNHAELKECFKSADYIANGRYVFNVGGNKFRIVVVVIFICGVMDIRFIGTHDEYNKIDCSTI